MVSRFLTFNKTILLLNLKTWKKDTSARYCLDKPENWYFQEEAWKEKNGTTQESDSTAKCQKGTVKAFKPCRNTSIASRNVLSVQVAVFHIIHQESSICARNQCPAVQSLLKTCCVGKRLICTGLGIQKKEINN